MSQGTGHRELAPIFFATLGERAGWSCGRVDVMLEVALWPSIEALCERLHYVETVNKVNCMLSDGYLISD